MSELTDQQNLSLQVMELEKQQVAAYEAYHKIMYETQNKLNELRKRIRKMEDSK